MTPSTATAVSYGTETTEEQSRFIEGGLSPVPDSQERPNANPGENVPIPNGASQQPVPLLESPTSSKAQGESASISAAIKSYFSRRR